MMTIRLGWISKILFVVSPVIMLLAVIIVALPSGQGLSKVQQNLDSLIYLLGAILIIFVSLYIVYRALGRAVIVIPLLIGLYMVLDNWGKSGEHLLSFYVFQIPLLITSLIYCVGFFINDTFISKKEEHKEENTPSTPS